MDSLEVEVVDPVAWALITHLEENLVAVMIDLVAGINGFCQFEYQQPDTPKY